MPLLGLVRGVLWSTEAKAGWVNSNQKSGALVSSMRVLSKEHKREGPGKRGRLLLSQGPMARSYQKRTFACDSADYYLNVKGLQH